MDYIIRGMEKEGNFRFFIGRTTSLVEKLRKSNDLYPVSSAALGRVVTATALMGYMLKNKKDKISIQVSGENQIARIIGTSDCECNVKGYISNPYANLPLREDGKLDVGGAIGKGKLTIIRDFGLKEPYIGQSELVTGEIAEDIAYYYLQSEQQPSAVGLGVLVDRDYSIRSAGGYIIQVMPDAEEEAIIKLEENIKKAGAITTLIDKGMNPEEIAKMLFKGLEISITDKKQVVYKCDCSREKMDTIIRSVGRDNIKELIEDGSAEIVCHFCNTKYRFVPGELKKML